MLAAHDIAQVVPSSAGNTYEIDIHSFLVPERQQKG
jgi:hypothetical protein